ncbi:unnamed protein product [Choristocarpus tenellus]
MSFLQFAGEDLHLKREKQAAFRATLDEQRLEKQRNGGNVDGDREQHGGDSSTSTRYDNNIPGLGGYLGSGVGGMTGRRDENRDRAPYMSALAEMNGRPPQARQQQFEKESQYRMMLKEQIDENTKRKDAERARLEQEKRQELEDLLRYEGQTLPRRQQHAQFQASPDYPLPSPINPQGAANQSHREHINQEKECQQEDDAHRNGHYQQRNSTMQMDHSYETSYHNRRTMNIHSTKDTEDSHRCEHHHQRHSLNRSPIQGQGWGQDVAPRTDSEPHYLPPRGHECEGDPTRSNGAGEDTAVRKLAFDPDANASVTSMKTVEVPQAEYDELTTLCRELLLEQKELRRKLEESEMRIRVEEQRRDDGEHIQRQGARCGPARARGLGMASQNKDRTQAQGRGGGNSAPRQRVNRDHREKEEGRKSTMVGRDVKTKPGVAFGSTVSRGGGLAKVESFSSRAHSVQKTSSSGSSLRPRASKSEPVSGVKERRQQQAKGHHGIPMREACSRETTFGGKRTDSARSSFARDTKEERYCAGSARGERLSTSRWTHVGENHDDRATFGTEQSIRRKGGRGGGMEDGRTIHDLLKGAPRFVSHREETQDEGELLGELGGESTFLAADNHIPHRRDPEYGQQLEQRQGQGQSDGCVTASQWRGNGSHWGGSEHR